MYSGNLVSRGDGSMQINSCPRGSVVGEIGVFHERRTATAVVTEDGRVLRFTEGTLERLARRNPRISSVVLRNLLELTIDRLVKRTDDLRRLI